MKKQMICIAHPKDRGFAVNADNFSRYIVGKVYDVKQQDSFGGRITYDGKILCDVGSNVGIACFRLYTNKSANVLLNL